MLQPINREQNMRNVWKERKFLLSGHFLFLFVHFYDNTKKPDFPPISQLLSQTYTKK